MKMPQQIVRFTSTCVNVFFQLLDYPDICDPTHCTVASGTFKYVVPRLTCQLEGAGQVMTFQPRDNIFECSTSSRASSVLSYDQLRASTKSR